MMVSLWLLAFMVFTRGSVRSHMREMDTSVFAQQPLDMLSHHVFIDGGFLCW